MFLLHLNKVLQFKDCPKFIRNAALEILQFNYLTTGDFFMKLTDAELEELCKMTDEIHTKDFEQFILDDPKKGEVLEYLILLVAILLLGEGHPDFTPEVIQESLPALTVFCNTESLYRKGIVEIIHENMSFLDTSKEFARIKK